MANYDGPTYMIVAGVGVEAGEPYYVPFWTSHPTWSPIVTFGPGGGGSTPSDQDINGYGYSHSG
jgi:hypothetical protein